MLTMTLLILFQLSMIPFPLASGYTTHQQNLDTGNVYYLLIVYLLLPMIIYYSGYESKSTHYTLLIVLIGLLLLQSFLVMNYFYFLILFELIVILMLLILLLFINSLFRIRTSFIWFFFSALGSIFFSISLFLLYSNTISSTPIFLFFLVPFLIKIPSFPFYYWLPEVHCEANSSISFLLAGLILKLGIYGMIRYLLQNFYLNFQQYTVFFLTLSLVGVLIVSSYIFRVFDIKKQIAFSSMSHLNLTFASSLSLTNTGILCSIMTSVAHGFSSVGMFLFASNWITKTMNRQLDNITVFTSVWRSLFLLLILSNLSFPLTLNFVAELLSYYTLLQMDYLYLLLYFVSTILLTLFWLLSLNRHQINYPYYYTYNVPNLLMTIWLLFIIYYLGYYFIS